MITALCNVYLNSILKLNLFKETFPRVFNVSDNWLIYFRGKYKKDAELFVTNVDVSKHTIIFNNLEEKSWALSVKEMLKYSKYDYIYIYIEDHFLVNSSDFFKEIIKEAVKNNIDYFSYSFFNADFDFNTLEYSYPEYSKHFAYFDLTKQNVDFFKVSHKQLFPFSLVSVVSKEYFFKVLGKDFYHNWILSPFIQKIMWKLHLGYPKNRILLYKLNRLLNLLNIKISLYTPASPLNLEKSIYEMDKNLLPVKIGVVNEEIFANFDDDNGAKSVSVIKRGMYPSKLKVEDFTKHFGTNEMKQYKLDANETINRQFYTNSSRQSSIYLKFIYVNDGKIRIQSSSENYVVNKNEYIYLYANIPHTIIGIKDSIYSVKIIPDENWKIGDYY